MQSPFRTAVDLFADRLTRNFGAADAVPAQPEDQLKAPVVELVEAVGSLMSLAAVARTEATAGHPGVRPDVGVSVDQLLIGHIELKAPGKGARGRSFTDQHDREQFKRFADHPNLVYTDGNEWALYRLGEVVGRIVRASGEVTSDGAGAYTDAECIALEGLLRDFLGWQPVVPRSPAALAQALAPLTRLLREAVVESLGEPTSSLSRLAGEWRSIFFPDADDAQFADAYAQTVTYALLLARVEGETELRAHAADRLDARHDLLAQVLRVLAQPAARAEVEVPVSLLERSIAAVDPGELARRARGKDVWLYFYEDFLAAYDPRLRKQSGVYYTPVEVVEAQVTLVAELLRERFDLELGFAEPDVVVLDPAVGTGTYLLAALADGVETAERVLGPAARAERTSTMARNLNGFEILVGAYAVAQLRLAQQVLANEGEIPATGLPVLLTDTLESPFTAPPHLAAAPLFEKRLAEENERARRIKADTTVLVCLGNPPYYRQVIDTEDAGDVDRQGGWVRFGDEGSTPILRDFLRDAPPVHAKNLYNLYVYFWRWALWKVFETGGRRGIVTFITASSYLRGPGFAGMRRHMREMFEELWILDLGGEGRGARRSENVFAIQTPVAIAIGYRTEEARTKEPARVRYARVDGTREEKLAALARISSVDDVDWRECMEGWTQPLLPRGEGDFFSWPLLTDIFPWQHSGAQFKRTWPIAPDPGSLGRRWQALLGTEKNKRNLPFRESRDRRVDREYPALADPKAKLTPIAKLGTDADTPTIARYAYRSFDRQHCLADGRVGDFLRPVLWQVLSSRQFFLTSLLSGLVDEGPAVTVTHLLPDLHHFRGSFGGKDVIALWRDAACTIPNVTAGLLASVGEQVGRTLAPEDLLAYVYALLAAPSYTTRFREELEIPGPRVPITSDAGLFERAVALGRRLVWLHTFGERFVPPGERARRVPQGVARYEKPIPATADGYPVAHSYDAATRELHVGDGVFAPVSPEVRSFSVSGLDVVGSWLGYRMRGGAGRRSSTLDEIRPSVWPEAFTKELLELLWVLEHTVALGPELDAILDAIVAGPTIPADALPQPTETERKPPPA
ncbi:N-6 DNA Methylase [Gaiella occulta]|uniref:site-specific DNA-methyltransferase (adenine-specific) n=1 Tax=Gaiella occulta TaxID=1002870 RepID=A0A7M2YTJ1_9ACTN|nr:type ISP restriction/modification enzyme [Gaiella occulta]RDI73472.1 N-6 DNA Methylase [Gaiella occulta]